MNGHPLRENLHCWLRAPEALGADALHELEQYLESCAVCQEAVEEVLRDGVVDRCRGVLGRVDEYLRDGLTVAPAPPLPARGRAAASVRFPGTATARGPLGTLCRYAIEAEVGRGGFGLVFRAFDERLERVVAVKVLRPEFTPHDVFRARFVNEARSAAGVRVFDHVVQVHEVIVPEMSADFPHPYLVMEWVEGQTLEARRQAAGGRLPWPEVVRIAREVAEGLAEVHRHITAHRDLKPGNIMLAGGTGRAKIMDFGLALPADISADERLTQPGGLLGTPCYMSPEQARGADVLDGRSDVFSLGVVLYELLTGRLPFAGKNNLELLKTIAAPEVEPPRPRRLNRALPRDLETIVRTCLAKDAAERYQTARALADDLRRLQEGRPIAARPAPLWEQTWKWTRRNKAAAALLVVVFTVAVGVAVGGWLVGRREAALRRQAEQDRDRARALEHTERVERARALARRGLWPEARRVYDEADADGQSDAGTLRVERLRCLFSYEERPKLPEELTRLAARTDLAAADAALVLLHRGDYLLSDWQRAKEALGLVARALAVPGGLAGADRVYAEGLAAAAAETAVQRFRAALAIDPFHHRANSALLTACLFLGRFDEARERATFMCQVFRDDPLPAFADAWAALLSGDRAACFRHLEPLEQKISRRRRDDLRAFFTLVAGMIDLAKQIDLEDPLGLAGALTRVGIKVSRLPGLALRALEPFGFGVPTVSRLADSLQTLNWAVLDFYWGRTDAAVRKLEAANRTHPDALLLYVQAIAQTKRAVERHKKDPAAAVCLAAEARDLAYRAADAPTILPCASYRYQARLAGLMLDHALAQEPSAADLGRPARMHRQSDRAAAEGREWPRARRTYLPRGIDVTQDLECVRFLIAAWLRDEPGDATALRIGARLDLRAGDWTSALRHADRVLRDRPADGAMQKVRRDALAGLRKLLP